MIHQRRQYLLSLLGAQSNSSTIPDGHTLNNFSSRREKESWNVSSESTNPIDLATNKSEYLVFQKTKEELTGPSSLNEKIGLTIIQEECTHDISNTHLSSNHNESNEYMLCHQKKQSLTKEQLKVENMKLKEQMSAMAQVIKQYEQGMKKGTLNYVSFNGKDHLTCPNDYASAASVENQSNSFYSTGRIKLFEQKLNDMKHQLKSYNYEEDMILNIQSPT